jgi:hypothetical protein
MTRRSFLALVGAAPLAAAEPWERQPFPDWSPELVDRLLTDSPWSRPVTVAFDSEPSPHSNYVTASLAQIGLPRIPGINWPGSRGPAAGPRLPGGTTSVRTEVFLTIRWSSALPIRQALALERWTRAGLGNQEAVELLRPPPDYVVEIFGLPPEVLPHGARRLEAELLQNSVLTLRSRPALKPTSCHVPEQGRHLSAELRFPRFESLSAEDGILEFAAQAGRMRISAKFRLKTMQYRGRLEL